jgi:hypothetical protein
MSIIAGWSIPARVATAMVEGLSASFIEVARYVGHDQSDLLMQSSSSSSPLRLLVRNICRTYKDGPVRFDTT